MDRPGKLCIEISLRDQGDAFTVGVKAIPRFVSLYICLSELKLSNRIARAMALSITGPLGKPFAVPQPSLACVEHFAGLLALSNNSHGHAHRTG